jgi:predicted O-methyltransferase YrrM
VAGAKIIDIPSAQRVVAPILEGVEGQLALPEAAMLYGAARAVTRGKPDACIVEIGSWKGRSTIALARGVVDGGRGGTVYAIDPHEVQPWSAFRAVDRMPDMLRNLSIAGIMDVVHPIRCTGHVARPRFADGSVDLLFVDGDHSYEGVIEDIEDWSSSLRSGSTVAFHDYRMPGVAQALVERVLRRGSGFRKPRWISNMLVFEYDTRTHWRWSESVALWRARLFIRFSCAWIRNYRRLQTNTKPWFRPLQLLGMVLAVKVISPVLKVMLKPVD